MSKDTVKNYSKSIRGKLLNIAKDENIFYQTVLTRYFQERLLYRISQTRYRNYFYLKRGALMYAYERFAARPTLDIDFLGQKFPFSWSFGEENPRTRGHRVSFLANIIGKR